HGVRELLRMERKVQAIARYREITGQDLKSSKAAVEAMGVGRWSKPLRRPTPAYRRSRSKVMTSNWRKRRSMNSVKRWTAR
ncbi:MAG: hypothetical protein R3212_11380, partial [Xanthomonadales bacterium]|nr:hypothetical protein [Xanthomonadales bacterium]